jgi:hypothetical protein
MTELYAIHVIHRAVAITFCEGVPLVLVGARRAVMMLLIPQGFESGALFAAEIGSMTGWWVFSLCPSASTTQSPQTARFRYDAK